jgi:hypothetical protein
MAGADAGGSCSDSTLNGNETDVDCGGPDCPKCSLGKTCQGDADCSSGACDTSVCIAPTTVFASQSAFSASACAQLTVLYFDGANETHNKPANLVVPPYSTQGVEFQPFLGTTVYPVIHRNQQFQILIPNHDGLLTNNSSPAPASNQSGRAIRANFSVPVHAVGTHVNVGDGGHIEAFDPSDALIAQAPISSGGFGGITTGKSIARVVVTNTFDADIKFGLYGFQFGPCVQ